MRFFAGTVAGNNARFRFLFLRRAHDNFRKQGERSGRGRRLCALEFSILALSLWTITKKTFYVELKPVNDKFVPDTMKVVGRTLQDFANSGRDPKVAMTAFRDWLVSVAKAAKPVFVGFNAKRRLLIFFPQNSTRAFLLSSTSRLASRNDTVSSFGQEEAGCPLRCHQHTVAASQAIAELNKAIWPLASNVYNRERREVQALENRDIHEGMLAPVRPDLDAGQSGFPNNGIDNVPEK